MLDRETVHRILTPSRGQLLICLLISLAVFFVANGQLLTGRLFQSPLLSDPYVHQSYLAKLSLLSSLQGVNLGVIILFWSGLYLVVYTLFWMLTNVLIEARNEVVYEAEYENKGEMSQRLRPAMVQGGLGLLLVVFLLLTANLGFPAWLNIMEQFVLNPANVMAWLYGLAALVGCTANIYAIWSLAQVVLAVH